MPGWPAWSWRCWPAARSPPDPAGCRRAATGAAAGAAPVPFPTAVLNAANAVLLRGTGDAQPGGPRQVVVIDPLVNGVTGSSRQRRNRLASSIVALAREKYPQFDIQPFSAATVSKGPYVMVGTFTPVNAQGQTAGTREAYRFCLVMVDLHAGKTVAKGVARARPDGVDTTPIGFLPRQPGVVQRCQHQELYRHLPGDEGGRPDQPDLPERHSHRLHHQRGDRRV